MIATNLEIQYIEIELYIKKYKRLIKKQSNLKSISMKI